jgi:hypothetical protein
MEAIKAQKLAPIWCAGDIQASDQGFSKERFASTCASFIRSGYPVLIWGQHLRPDISDKHVICAVGFREAAPPSSQPGAVSLQDGETTHLYIHDDNLGPNVRFKIIDNGVDSNGNPLPVTIRTDPPSGVSGSPTVGYPEIRPEAMCIAVHECLRSSPDSLHIMGKNMAHGLCSALNVALNANSLPSVSLSLSTRFIKLSDYLGGELAKTLGGRGPILGRVRLELCEKVRPMSLHIAVIRIALANSTPLVDLIYDTTDTDLNRPVFAYIAYDKTVALVLSKSPNIGVAIHAF